MSVLTRAHSATSKKPAKWPVQYGRVAPEWRWAWGDLLSLYPVWSGGGGRVHDIFGHNHADLESAVLADTGWQAGEHGVGFYLDNSDAANNNGLRAGKLDLSAAPGLTMAVTFVEFQGAQNTARIIAIQHSGGDDLRIFLFGHDATPSLNLDMDDGSFTRISTSDIVRGQRHTVVATYDGTTVALYLDGDLVGSNTESVDLAGADGEVRFGIEPVNSSFTHMRLDMAGVWGRGLSASEVRQLSRDPFGPFRMGRRTMVFVPTTGQDIAVGQAIETDLAMSIGVEKSVSVGQAEETDLAQGVSVEKAVAIAQAVETDSAFGIDIERVVSIGQATEIDEALLIDVAKALSVGLSIETSQAFSVTALKEAIVNVGQAVETNFAQGITARKEVGVGLAQETDEGFVVTPVFGVAIGQAVETNEAFAIAIEKVVPIGQAVELDSARPVSAVLAGPGGTVPVFMYYYRQMRAN